MYFSALFSRKFTEKGSFLIPQILAVMMSFSVPEMSTQEDKIRF